MKGKEKRSYVDDWDIDDDDIEGLRDWNLQEKLNSDRYCARFVQQFESGEGFDLRYFQARGFNTPILFKNKSGLGLRIPTDTFSVNDVKQCVGARRLVDVMDVRTQKALVMNMRDWCKYYNSPERERLLNVISLEFSHTKLDHYVASPTVVRQIDWVDRVWPPYLRESQTNTTNDMTTMKYPKVRKYVLMSVRGCYTDFHVDFGGTSVWYHILRGEKIFWLIPPTERNLRLFEQWCVSGKQGDVFFADLVSACERVSLNQGSTFFLPPGWIHGVYTPDDSLVFGGNYLHTFGTRLQLRVWKLEDAMHVKMRFRYPFYSELHWYVLARYVACLMKKEYVVRQPDEMKMEEVSIKVEESENQTVDSNGNEDVLQPVKSVNEESQPDSRLNDEKESQSNNALDKKTNVAVKLEIDCSEKQREQDEEADAVEKDDNWVHLTKFELDNLQIIINWLTSQPPDRRTIPVDIIDPEGLLRDAQKLVNWHRDDDFYGKAVTGVPVLKWQIPKLTRGGGKKAANRDPKPRKVLKGEGGPSRRRIRCMRCEPCRRTNCRDCVFCQDMVKYGGPGIMKKCCIQKGCIAPLLPNNAICGICSRMERSTEEQRESDDYDPLRDLFECGICWTIAHPVCMYTKSRQEGEEHIEGVPNEDLPNYWECPQCIRAGKKGSLRPRIPRGLTILRAFENAVMEGSCVQSNELLSDGNGCVLANPPRRKVGRPRKHVMNGTLSGSACCEPKESQPIVVKSTPDGVPNKKKRGRPKTEAVEANETPVDSCDSQSDSKSSPVCTQLMETVVKVVENGDVHVKDTS